MNTYHLTKCFICGQVLVMPGEGNNEEVDTFMVHGTKNLTRAKELLLNGNSVIKVAHRFCSNCGNELPCGCPEPKPQLGWKE